METDIIYKIIDKENIDDIEFGSDEILELEAERNERTEQLSKAQRLGNLDKHHVRIRFVNAAKERLETTVTIWAVTKKHVVLKSEKLIPIASICHLKLY